VDKKKSLKNPNVTDAIAELTKPGEAPPVVKVVRRYNRTGSFRRRDLRRVLGDQTRGVSAGEKGLEELIIGKSKTR